MKRILGLARVKNEQDIIESFVRHHIRFLDRLVVVDNASLDDTFSILKKLEAEFDGLTILQDDRTDFDQSEAMTLLLKKIQKDTPADYIFLLDADEFIYQPGNPGFARELLLEILQVIPPGGYGLLPWKTFVHVPGHPVEDSDYPRNMAWKRTAEDPLYYKAVPRLDGATSPEIIVDQGNHGVRDMENRPLPSVHLSGLELLHYPVRSLDQLVSKSLFGCLAYLKTKNRAPGNGYQWFKILDLIRAGKTEEIDLCRESFLYAQTEKEIDWDKDVEYVRPVFEYTRSYSSGQTVKPLTLVARLLFTQDAPAKPELGRWEKLKAFFKQPSP